MKAVMKRLILRSNTRFGIFHLRIVDALLCISLVLLACGFILLSPGDAVAQFETPEGGHTLWGDIKIDDSKADTPAPLSITIILYEETGRVIGRQNVSTRGRYRFSNLKSGNYEIAIESEETEVARVRLTLAGFYGASGLQHDFELQWKSRFAASKPMTGVISAADVYVRTPANQSLFKKAQEAAQRKQYEQAATLLKEILAADKQDFQVWSLLGSIYFTQENVAEAEKAYLKAIEVRPAFALALFNLGRLRASQKRFEEAIEPLTRAIEAQPRLAEANLLLGEAYLQIKKGSKAIGYLEEAARLGRPEAHLRLAWLYNAAGLKDKAAIEYEEFLKKKPDYPERKKLKEYISANKKS